MSEENSAEVLTEQVKYLNVVSNVSETAVVSRANPERKVYNAPRVKIANQVPDEILNDEKLATAMQCLPPNYNFEIHKMVNFFLNFEAIFTMIMYELSNRFGESDRQERKELPYKCLKAFSDMLSI